jgi:hypothetical protein
MTLSVRLSTETEQRLERYCRRHGVTKTEVVRRLIEQQVAEAPSKGTSFELAESMGIIGAFDGPEDLAVEHRRHIQDKLRARGFD